jgi:hypothetical protein
VKRADVIAVAVIVFCFLAWMTPTGAAIYYRHQALKAYELARVAENRIEIVHDAIITRDDAIARLEAELTDAKTELADAEALLVEQAEGDQ